MNRSAKLIDDVAYISAHDTQSQYAYKYHTALVPDKLGKDFAPHCTPYLGSECKQFNTNGAVIDQYNAMIAKPARARSTATEIYGGPFKARGDGALKTPDVLSEMWTPARGYEQHCNKPLSEITYDTWACIEAPLANEVDVRGGVSTRLGVQYIANC